jgi:hypothetical protein
MRARGGAVQFVADAMLGKLAKWLRILGHDTLYQSHYPPGALDRMMREGRLLLTRSRETAANHPEAVLISRDRVGEQLGELNAKVPLAACPAKRFTRCLICNTPLEEPPPEESREKVPEYVYYENLGKIRFCPSCGRQYWPGSHRKRMVKQLEEWGLVL